MLMRTCKRFNALVEPILWTDIELHEQGFHESSWELNDPPPFIPTSQRRYHRRQPWGRGQGARDKAAKLFLVLQLLHDEDLNRMQELAKRVKNLCTVIQPDTGPWDEVKQQRQDVIQIWQLLPFFTNLETLELHGDNYYSSESEKMTPEFTAPPLNTPIGQVFTGSLKHLYLCQPSPGEYSGFGTDYSWSTRSEAACLSDWPNLLQATGSTLETLVLEQRPAAAYIENDGVTELQFLRNDTSGSGNRPLVHMVKRLIQNEELPGLKKVYLHGMVVGEKWNGRPSTTVPAGGLMRILETRAVQCEARLGQWCFFDHGPGYTRWASWNGADDDDDDEGEEDGEDEKEKEEEEDSEAKMKWHTLLASV
ncbi:hypothetical protein QQX98_008894 [Neonectria punicea]|uniref:F-box domain-containing protein n=1 Tax=Neonectria punicea TaxID=979145 RepID=A0ABR1GU06_9HYPO